MAAGRLEGTRVCAGQAWQQNARPPATPPPSAPALPHPRSQDMTASARAGKLDPVIGRDEEMRRVMHILCRRTKNNPVLVSQASPINNQLIN